MGTGVASTQDLMFMDLALEEARQAAREGEIPVGAVLVRKGQVVARAHNRREQDRTPQPMPNCWPSAGPVKNWDAGGSRTVPCM
jgi:hypothetical protein